MSGPIQINETNNINFDSHHENGSIEQTGDLNGRPVENISAGQSKMTKKNVIIAAAVAIIGTAAIALISAGIVCFVSALLPVAIPLTVLGCAALGTCLGLTAYAIINYCKASKKIDDTHDNRPLVMEEEEEETGSENSFASFEQTDSANSSDADEIDDQRPLVMEEEVNQGSFTRLAQEALSSPKRINSAPNLLRREYT